MLVQEGVLDLFTLATGKTTWASILEGDSIVNYIREQDNLLMCREFRACAQ